MALEWHFERSQWQLFRRKSLEIPCIFSLLQGIWQRTVRSGLDPPADQAL